MYYLWLKTVERSSVYYNKGLGQIRELDDAKEFEVEREKFEKGGWSVATMIDYGCDTLVVLTQRPFTS